MRDHTSPAFMWKVGLTKIHKYHFHLRTHPKISLHTVKEVQPILTFVTIAKNSDWSS